MPGATIPAPSPFARAHRRCLSNSWRGKSSPPYAHLGLRQARCRCHRGCSAIYARRWTMNRRFPDPGICWRGQRWRQPTDRSRRLHAPTPPPHGQSAPARKNRQMRRCSGPRLATPQSPLHGRVLPKRAVTSRARVCHQSRRAGNRHYRAPCPANVPRDQSIRDVPRM